MTCTGCSRCYRNIAGAGVLIVTNSKTFPGELDIVLVKDYTGDYNDAGGKSEGRISFEVASSELLEESRGMLYISGSALSSTKYVDVGKSTKHLYRCYIVHVPNISCRTYYSIDTSRMGHAYQETTGMTRFPVRYVMNLIRSHALNDYLYDDKYIARKINGRVKSIIKKVFV